MSWYLVAAGGWLACSVAVAIVFGRAVRLADGKERRSSPAGRARIVPAAHLRTPRRGRRNLFAGRCALASRRTRPSSEAPLP